MNNAENADNKKNIRVSLYARTSTRDKQEVENQLQQLRQYCQQNNYEIIAEYVDLESGGNPNRKRFKELFKNAYQKKFDIVLFWALDRLSREGAKQTINYLAELESYGVKFISYTEPYLNSVGIFKEAIISILATLAKQEKVRISERVKAGLEIARLRGQRIGRTPTSTAVIKRVLDIYEAEKLSVRDLSQKAEVPRSTVFRILQDFRQGNIDRNGIPVRVS